MSKRPAAARCKLEALGIIRLLRLVLAHSRAPGKPSGNRFRSTMSKSKFSLAGATLLFAISLAANAGDIGGDAKLSSFFQSYLDARFKMQPTDATRLGDHRFDNQLDDLSPAARKGWVTFARHTLKALPKEVDYKSLSRDGQIDFEIFQHDLTAQLWLAENTKPFEEDPRTFGNYISDSVYVAHAIHAPKETNVANVIARLGQMPRIIATAQQPLKHPFKPILETAIRQNHAASPSTNGNLPTRRRDLAA